MFIHTDLQISSLCRYLGCSGINPLKIIDLEPNSATEHTIILRVTKSFPQSYQFFANFLNTSISGCKRHATSLEVM